MSKDGAADFKVTDTFFFKSSSAVRSPDEMRSCGMIMMMMMMMITMLYVAIVRRMS